MKRTLSVIIIFVLALSLCACNKPANPDATDNTPPAAVSDSIQEADVTPDEMPAERLPETRVIVDVRKTVKEEMDPAEGKQPILHFAYETPFVDINGRDQAAETINEYIAMLDETYWTGNDYGNGFGTGFNRFLELAIDNFTYAYETGENISLEMSSNRTVSVERSDSKILSVLFSDYTYTGGAHGSYDVNAYVFDTEDGSLVTLDKLSKNEEEFKEYVFEAIRNKAESDSDYQITDTSDEALGVLWREGSWYLDRDGFVIFPDESEMASYAQGILFFKIPYSELEGLIDNKWIPTARVSSGEVKVILQDEYQDGSMEVIDRVVADENGEKLCLIVEGLVQDVRISKVSYADYNAQFLETAQLWNCSSMEDCALQIESVIPDGMPDLMISYTDSEGMQVKRLLTQNGEDGSLILAEDNISAVG